MTPHGNRHSFLLLSDLPAIIDDRHNPFDSFSISFMLIESVSPGI
jgi:hypothetical protein